MAVALRAKGFVSDEVVSEVNELNETSKSKARRLYIMKPRRKYATTRTNTTC